MDFLGATKTGLKFSPYVILPTGGFLTGYYSSPRFLENVSLEEMERMKKELEDSNKELEEKKKQLEDLLKSGGGETQEQALKEQIKKYENERTEDRKTINNLNKWKNYLNCLEGKIFIQHNFFNNNVNYIYAYGKDAKECGTKSGYWGKSNLLKVS